MRKLSKEAKATRTLYLANPPKEKEVVVHVVGSLTDIGKQSFDAWWLPGYWDTPEQPQGQAFYTHPDGFKRQWEERGYTLRFLPSKFKFGEA